ncbi:MAG: hypothetical protein ACR2RE_13955, partial [Geminicoccaceae bacterium]
PEGDEATQNQAHGGWTAAPTVAKIISRAGPILGLPPADAETEAWFRDRLLVGEAFNGRLKKTEPSFAAIGEQGWVRPAATSRLGGEACACGTCSTSG